MHKSGIVSICGQPNVGKSTMLNGFLGEKVAIVSNKPETTRDTIRGIFTEKDCQIIFVDTPGIHKPHNLLGKTMLSRAQSSLMDPDIILFVTEKKIAFNKEDLGILKRLPEQDSDIKVILVINKVDRIKNKPLLLPLIEKASEMYPFDEIVPICALKKPDLERLLKVIRSYLSEGPVLWDEDTITDKSERFMVREIIREKILSATYEEVPHSVAVVVDEMTEEGPDKVLKIYATIFVERASQRSIIIGKSGEMIKKIKKHALPEIKRMLDRKAHLDLWVKVSEKWKQNPSALSEMGYTD